MPQLTWLQAEQAPHFPKTDQALDEPDGLLALGGALNEQWLLAAYERGIFPWYSEGEPIMWWSPAPRMVLIPGQANVNRSLRKHFRKQNLTIRANSCFDLVIDLCSDENLRQEGTWITTAMKRAYSDLHQQGWAHSIEVFDEHGLIGGLYGIGIDATFYGESMFSLKSNASKYAFIALSEWAQANQLGLIDCQLHNPYLESLGAHLISRRQFESYLPQKRTRLSLPEKTNLTTYLENRLISTP